ncbi:Histone-lysine N-methyltransferase set-26 [Caenorhabditis elegans]|uniref:Histone-lysine N-methyltransferase set-26 n=1 Tax=Caenorhabditis elegans TaxID=6239 RepID=SET26_CAEEL|nr:Histone-lysine N-methyltransferase set-26 [Caenorhabditis elegans]Q9U263.3 RecName: Full=Histone-lysine N-methyltransferase set-26 [Caenorhabditis elegans]CAB63382.3 Histone-lysine N-methyltransferase set-26 [Caenorhabditis elegans]|eukprot:NP_502971.3 Histone-lysine N-methyltransferase set-26 [Caenorhabditis elegans]
MADGEHTLPADEELFEQPPLQQQQPEIAEPIVMAQEPIQGVSEDPQASEATHEAPDNYPVDHQMENQEFYQEPQIPEPQQIPQIPVFQPAAYNPPNYVAPQQRANNFGEPAAAADSRPLTEEEQLAAERPTEDTVWIDSDDDTDVEEAILRANFWLPYSDHNYDPPDPADRIILPTEGPFPCIAGLDEDCNIVKQWMPEDAVGPGSPGTQYRRNQQTGGGLPSTSVAPQQQQLPVRHNIQNRPMVAAQPFSIGGNQVEYGGIGGMDSRMQQRGVVRDGPQYRVMNDFGNGLPMRGQLPPRNSPAANAINRVREQQQQMYHQAGARGSLQQRVPAPAAPTPGSYQHIVNAVPVGGANPMRRVPPQARPGMIGGAANNNRARPIHVTRPMDTQEFEHPVAPAAAAPPRRVVDVAPHRMTPEQRQELQQMNRQRAAPQFPAAAAQRSAEKIVIQQRPGASSSRAPRPSMAQEDLLRSPTRRLSERVPQEHQTPVLEPRRFQVKVTDTYSTPIPKASDQLPAQLTEEDPPEESAAAAAPEDVPDAAPEDPPKGILKPTPPHRMTQEEKNAHFARLTTDKEKPTSSASILPQDAAPPHVPPPPPPPLVLRPHHQDETLAMVQSVFESKPRQPDTPKDKEAISKIADLLRFSADEFTGQSGSSAAARQRTVSGSAARAQTYQMHHQQQQQHHHQMPMDQRKRHSSGRYDALMGAMPLQQQPPPPPPSQFQHTDSIAHRPRGRPKGTRHPSVAVQPQRSGGARTLPPRAQTVAMSARNGANAKNSDSESEGIDEAAEESWTMRCHCGMDHGDGDTIECEGCKTWQHMACMGLTLKSNTSKYKCEMCLPRRLPVSKAEAAREQERILNRLRAAAKKQKRKSEPVEQKQKSQPSTSRKSAPMALQQQPAEPRVAQLNDYSKQASALLFGMEQTAGADTLLAESRLHKKARRMFVEEAVEALVTTDLVQIRQVILEVNGHVSMSNEVKRQPGGGNCIFMYDGLMKGTAGEDMGDGQELVCIDTKRKGNDTKFTRRSCVPNCVLKHVLGSNATLGIMIVATKDITRNTEVTLPFDADWRESEVELECAEHMKELQACPFESERRRFAAERHRAMDHKKREAEEARRADEERRRLEEEVRRERAAKTKQMDEAEKARLEAEKAAEKEKKAKEREEAKERKKMEVEASAAAAPESSNSITAREERRIQQAEEMFRRQEEEGKRKEARRRSKSVTPGVLEAAGTAAREDAPEASIPAPAPSPPASRRSVSRTTQPSTSSFATPTEPPAKNKRMRSVVPPKSEPASSAKRVRATTVATPKDTTASNDSRKRKSSATGKTPVAKRSKNVVPTSFGLALIEKELREQARDSTVLEMILPDYIMKEKRSGLLAGQSPDFSEVRAQIEEENRMKERFTKREAKKKAVEKAKEKEKKEHRKEPKKANEPGPAPKSEKAVEKAVEKVEKKPKSPQKPPAKPTAQKPPLKKTEEVDGIEREASESSSKESSVAPEEKKNPKKITFAEYNSRRSQKREAGECSTPPAVTRRGFIPSTEGEDLVNVELSAIPLDDHPSSSNTAPTTTIAPSVGGAPKPTSVVVKSPSTRSRTRGAASESVDDAPAEHSMSLQDRVFSMFGSTVDAPAPPPPPPASAETNSRRSRSTRWN